MFCPVCNGIKRVEVSCGKCNEAMNDCGRTLEWSDPYAPYEPVSISGSTRNQVGDAICLHTALCPSCAHTIEVCISEWQE